MILSKNSGTDTSALARSNGPSNSCSSNSASVNRSLENLVEAFLRLDLKSMFNDRNGNNNPSILSTGYLRPHPSSTEIGNNSSAYMKPLHTL